MHMQFIQCDYVLLQTAILGMVHCRSWLWNDYLRNSHWFIHESP